MTWANRRWCCRCHTDKPTKGGKVQGGRSGLFTCADCLLPVPPKQA